MKNSFKIHFAIIFLFFIAISFSNAVYVHAGSYCQYNDESGATQCVEMASGCAADPYFGTEVSECPNIQTTKSSAESSGNAAKNINVKLQVPLPFVAMGCVDENGSPTVCDLKDYIMGVYKLLIGVGALFAVVMMIIAGYQWIFSGGSSDKIGAAKNKIFSASIGLILALVSYVVLNSISPRLVSMTLPEIDSVQGIDFEMGETCQNSARLLEKERELGISFGKLPVIGGGATQATTRDKAYCGYKYYVLEKGLDGRTPEKARSESDDFCKGGYCDQNQTCLLGQCQDVAIYGSISWPSLSNTYLDKISLFSVCNDGTKKAVPNQMVPVSKLRDYKIPWIYNLSYEGGANNVSVYSSQEEIDGIWTKQKGSYSKAAEDSCGSLGEFKGFVLKAEINDNKGGWDWILPTIDDDFALGKDPQAGGCLPKPFGDFDKVNFNLIDKERLFQVSDIDGVLECNINITPSWNTQ